MKHNVILVMTARTKTVTGFPRILPQFATTDHDQSYNECHVIETELQRANLDEDMDF